MATSDLQRFIGGTQDKGINTFEPDISTEITWDESTVNVTGGRRRGVGVRPGIAPIPGHADTETLAGTNTNGLMKSEGTGGVGLINRKLVYACVPVTLAPYAGAYPKSSLQYYVWIVGLTNGSDYSIDACISALLSSSVNIQEANIKAGLAQSSYREESPLVRRHKTEMLNLPTLTTPAAADMQAQLKAITGRYWTPTAHISVSGKRVPYQWMLGKVTSAPAVTTAPSVNLWQIALDNATATGPFTILGGEPSEIETRDGVDNKERLVTWWCLTSTGAKLDMKYTKSLTKANTQAAPAYNTSTANYTSLASATKTGASTAYASASAALVNDPESFTNSRHEAILLAGEKPIAIVYQDWLKATKGMMPRFVDLSSPGSLARFLGYDSSEPSVMPTLVTTSFGAVNTGILRANTTYEFGVSLYHKQLDYETNVGRASKKTTGATDFVCMYFNAPLGGAGGTVWYDSAPNFSPGWEFTETAISAGGYPGRGFHINDFAYRFYYRQEGTTEWLPAGAYDAAQYFFQWDWPATPVGGPALCTGPNGSLPGGYANGFIDYSPLPQQRYICVLQFRGRAFWFAEKSMHFSLQNNIYAYPTRNIVPAQTGAFRGGIVHTQMNMTDSTSRLVVFMSDQSYQARFTGNLSYQNVRISEDTVGQFSIEGSDFSIDYLCEATAYSYRAACVAEGTLYFWGPQGVYWDDGNMAMPEKLSGSLEPDIFDLVDQARISEVHCIYNKRTKEVVWFYPPKVADATYPTYGLSYNVENDRFSYLKFKMQVDSAQIVKIENDSSSSKIAGERIMIHARATAASTSQQRTFFFDELVRAGEQYPLGELMVKTIATPSAGVRRLTVAGGGVSLASVQVGDLIAIQNALAYATSLTAADDMVAAVAAVNSGAGTLDITLPAGASMDSAATIAQGLAFPIWHAASYTAAGLHGITYQLQTNYWMPTGVADQWAWRYIYLLFRYLGIPAPTGPKLALAWRTLVCGGFVSDTLTLANNSDGQCQIHHPLRNTAAAAIGQALKYRVSGIHIGNPWTLEYLEAHCTMEKGFTLKQFEG